MTTFTPEGTNKEVKDHKLIAIRYLKSNFTLDFIAWIPLVFFFDMTIDKYYRLFYLIKLIRIMEGLNVFNVNFIIESIKKAIIKRALINIENDIEMSID